LEIDNTKIKTSRVNDIQLETSKTKVHAQDSEKLE
jgi:hypothetical protein